MTQDFSLWKHQVGQAIRGLSAFTGSAGAHEAANAGFRAALHALYAESHFAEFMSYQGWRQAGVSRAAARALRTLQQQLDAYDEPDTDAAILADPAWWRIRHQAAQAVALLR